MKPAAKNLFAAASLSTGSTDGEDVLPLLDSPHLRIERIVSNGQCSPPDFWYDQMQDEWVVLLRGSATLEFEDRQLVGLAAGDYLLIERHVRHRVDKTSSDALWLAVHYEHGNAAGV